MKRLIEKLRGFRRSPRRPLRRGATIVEMAIVQLLFLAMVLGMLDVGAAVVRYDALTQAARQGARQAIVHGDLATKLGSWGPASYSGTGADSHPIAAAIRPSLAIFDPSQVRIAAEWPDGGNEATKKNRVRVTVTAPYRPSVAFIFGNRTFTLQASSTMKITH